MAWTDACRFALRVKVETTLWRKENRRGLEGILGRLSQQSGIPRRTLRGWYFNNADPACIIACIRCGKRQVEIDARTGKPRGPTGRYYGLCGRCRETQAYISKLDSTSLCRNKKPAGWRGEGVHYSAFLKLLKTKRSCRGGK